MASAIIRMGASTSDSEAVLQGTKPIYKAVLEGTRQIYLVSTSTQLLLDMYNSEESPFAPRDDDSDDPESLIAYCGRFASIEFQFIGIALLGIVEAAVRSATLPIFLLLGAALGADEGLSGILRMALFLGFVGIILCLAATIEATCAAIDHFFYDGEKGPSIISGLGHYSDDI